MEVRAIRTEADYLAALQEVSRLIDLDPSMDSPPRRATRSAWNAHSGL